MNKFSNLVEESLIRNEHARSSDKVLLIDVLQMSGANLSWDQVQLIKNLSVASIIRTRHKLQISGMYLPTEPAARERQIKSLEEASIPWRG